MNWRGTKNGSRGNIYQALTALEVRGEVEWFRMGLAGGYI